MRKKHELDEDEKNIFREAMRGAVRHTHTKITPEKLPKKRIKSTPSVQNFSNTFALYEEEEKEEVGAEDWLEFHRSGLQHKVLRKLRQGQYNAEAILDLHGMRANEAKDALSHFLINCMRNNIKHALIIHGKGRGEGNPILKNKVNQWLRQIEFVLAFCSATHEDGGAGAVYVLLKRRSRFES